MFGQIRYNRRTSADCCPCSDATVLDRDTTDPHEDAFSQRDRTAQVASRGDMTKVPQDTIVVHRCPGINDAVPANSRAWLNDRAGEYHSPRTKRGGLIHVSFWMNDRQPFCKRKSRCYLMSCQIVAQTEYPRAAVCAFQLMSGAQHRHLKNLRSLLCWGIIVYPSGLYAQFQQRAEDNFGVATCSDNEDFVPGLYERRLVRELRAGQPPILKNRRHC